MPQRIPGIGEDVTHLMSPRIPAIGDDVSHLFDEPASAATPVDEPHYSRAGWYSGAGEVLKGAAKGLLSTAANVGPKFWHAIPGVSDAIDSAYGMPGLSKAALAYLDEAATTHNTLQSIGKTGEQIAEVIVPSRALSAVATKTAEAVAPHLAPVIGKTFASIAPRAAVEAAGTAALATAQGNDPTAAAAFGATAPLVGKAASSVAPFLSDRAEALVRSAVKPTVSAMRRIAGSSITGLDAQANKLARFILDNGLTTPAKAEQMLMHADQELRYVLQSKNAPTDAPQRAMRYLTALERSAARQATPANDVAAIRNAAAEVLQSSLGKDVVTMVPTPHPTLVQANGQPFTVLQPQASRALRSDVMADEALDRARATSQWDTRKAYGEMKGASMESSKAVERGLRDAVKTAVPEAAPILRQQSQAIVARDALDRMALRAGNRDALSLPGVTAAASEMAVRKVPILGIATQWLRNNQMRAGVWADRLAKAIDREDVTTAANILRSFGVSVAMQANPSQVR